MDKDNSPLTIKTGHSLTGFRDFITNELTKIKKGTPVPLIRFVHYIFPDSNELTESVLTDPNSYMTNVLQPLINKYQTRQANIVNVDEALYCHMNNIALFTPEANLAVISHIPGYKEVCQEYLNKMPAIKTNIVTGKLFTNIKDIEDCEPASLFLTLNSDLQIISKRISRPSDFSKFICENAQAIRDAAKSSDWIFQITFPDKGMIPYLYEYDNIDKLKNILQT